jgi:hypothetical protein
VTAPTLTRTVVAAPQATVPVHSLIRSAITNLDGEEGWQRGLTYAPETPGGYRGWMRCTTETYEDLVEKTPVVSYEPWELQVEHPCHSRFGISEAQLDDELRRAMDATESFAIARELWAGDLTHAAVDAGDAATPNLSLVDGPTILNGGTAVPVHRALGIIEQALGEALRGQRAYVHLSRETLALFGYLQSTGNLLTSFSGNLLVADAGYPGTAPIGETGTAGVSWIYGTGPVVVRRTPLFAFDDEVASLDIATNTYTRRASKVVAATFDDAAHFAVPVDLNA